MSANLLNDSQFFITAYFIASGNRLHLIHYVDLQKHETDATIPRSFELSLSEVEGFLDEGSVQVDLRNDSVVPPSLAACTRQLGCERAAYIPILQNGQLRGVVLIGARDGEKIGDEVVEAFYRTIRLTANALEISLSPSEPINDRRTLERRAIDTLASNAANVDDLSDFY